MADGRREGSQTPFAHDGVTEGEGESITVAGSTFSLSWTMSVSFPHSLFSYTSIDNSKVLLVKSIWLSKQADLIGSRVLFQDPKGLASGFGLLPIVWRVAVPETVTVHHLVVLNCPHQWCWIAGSQLFAWWFTLASMVLLLWRVTALYYYIRTTLYNYICWRHQDF
jgi:hypothetical protein